MLWDGQRAARASGDGLEYHDATGDAVIDFRTLDKDAARRRSREQIALESAAETMRLIYVALTRAVHRCYLVVGTYLTQARQPPQRQRKLPRAAELAGGRRRAVAAASWSANTLQPQDIEAAWSALAQRHAPHVGAGAAAAASLAQRLTPQHAAPAAAGRAGRPRPISRPGGASAATAAWRMAPRHEAAAIDHDLRVPPAAPDDAGALRRRSRRRRHPALSARRGGRRVPACGVRARRLQRRRPAGPRPSMPRCGVHAPALPAVADPARAGRACCCACCTTCCTRRCPAALRLADVPPQSRKLVETGVPPARRGNWSAAALGAMLRQQGYDRAGAGLRLAVGLPARLHRPGVRARSSGPPPASSAANDSFRWRCCGGRVCAATR